MGEINSSYYDGYNYALDMTIEFVDERLKNVHPSEKRLIDLLLDLRNGMKESQV